MHKNYRFEHRSPELVEDHLSGKPVLHSLGKKLIAPLKVGRFRDRIFIDGEPLVVHYSLSLNLGKEPLIHIKADLEKNESSLDSQSSIAWITPWHRMVHTDMHFGALLSGRGIINRALKLMEDHIKANWPAYRGRPFAEERDGKQYLIERTELPSALAFLERNGYVVRLKKGEKFITPPLTPEHRFEKPVFLEKRI